MKHLLKTALWIFFVLFAPRYSEAQNADSLLKYMDNLMSAPKDKTANVLMTLTEKNGEIKTREAIMKQKGKDKKLYRYIKPESQAGVCTLSLPGDVMWLFMPAFDEPVKITLLSKSQAFTGTDFSYEDMNSQSYSEKYKPTLAASTNPGQYTLQLIPRSTKSDYSKIILSMDKTNYYPVKMDFYDKKGVYFKVATYKYLKKGKYWYAEEVVMKDLKKNHSTSIVLSDLKFDQGLKDDEFVVEKLMVK